MLSGKCCTDTMARCLLTIKYQYHVHTTLPSGFFSLFVGLPSIILSKILHTMYDQHRRTNALLLNISLSSLVSPTPLSMPTTACIREQCYNCRRDRYTLPRLYIYIYLWQMSLTIYQIDVFPISLHTNGRELSGCSKSLILANCR